MNRGNPFSDASVTESEANRIDLCVRNTIIDNPTWLGQVPTKFENKQKNYV